MQKIAFPLQRHLWHGLVAAAVGGVCLPPATAEVTNHSPTATASIDTLTFGTASMLNDQWASNQPESSSPYREALIWTTAQNIDYVLLNWRPNFVSPGFSIQVAYNPNPNLNTDVDWTTLQSFTGISQTGTSAFGTTNSGGEIYGVRVVATAGSSPSDRMRLNEIWTFNDYENLALTASSIVGTRGGVGSWGSSVTLGHDQSMATQAFTSNAVSVSNAGIITYNWASAQDIGGVFLYGGAGVQNGEYITDGTIDWWDGSSWQNAVTLTGNAQKINNIWFDDTITTDSLRLTITGASGDGLARVGEMLIFAVPEPSTPLLVGFGLGVILYFPRSRRCTTR